MTFTKENYKEKVSPYPIRHFNINLTDDCNLRCYYCFAEHTPRNMTWDTMKATIDFAISQWLEKKQLEKTLNFTFFGGEPTLRYNDLIVPAVNYIKSIFTEKKIDIKYWPGFSITTNGTLLDREKLKFFKENHFSLLLSMDGNEESQNLNRPKENGQGSFSDIIKNIPDLLEFFPNTTFRSTITPKTVDKIMENYFFVQDLGFKHYFLIPNECEIWSEEQKTLMTYQMGVMMEYFYESISNHIEPLYFSPIMKSFEYLLQFSYSNKSIQRCGLGTTSVGVSVEGKLCGCQEYSSYITENDLFYIGDVFTGINQDKHLQLLNSYLEEEHTQSNSQKECNEYNCICYNFCNKNHCPSKNFTLHNNMNINSDIICHWKKICYTIAETLLERAAKENNIAFQQYLRYYFPKEKEENI